MMSFDTAVRWILTAEGGFQNNPADDGNWTGGKQGVGLLVGTKYGISAAAYPHLDIVNMTETLAMTLYHADYWNPMGGQWLKPGTDLLALDCAVNQGVGFAISAIQKAAGVQQDGHIGPITAAAALGVEFLSRFAAARAVRYANSRRFTSFGEGWMLRLLRAHAAALASLAGPTA